LEHFGNYILLERISSGGMADIYKAARLGSSGFFKLLAIKRIKPHIAQDAGFQEMFIKEAHVQSTFSHPNVVNIFDFGKENDDFFIAMEYLNGVPLRTLLQMLRFRHERLRTELILHIFDSLLKGLDYIHNLVAPDGTSMTIIHRDLDPNNIFLTFSGEIKLIDFGIADADFDVENPKGKAIKGKFSYFAPEILNDQPADQRSDLFSASLLLYELLTLHKLFAAESREEVLNTIMSLDIPAKINELSVDDHLKKILHHALERDPSRRYSTAAEFRDDLRIYQQEHQVRVAPKTFPALMDHLFQKEQQEELEKNQFYFSILKDRDLTDDDHTCIISPTDLDREIEDAIAPVEDIAKPEKPVVQPSPDPAIGQTTPARPLSSKTRQFLTDLENKMPPVLRKGRLLFILPAILLILIALLISSIPEEKQPAAEPVNNVLLQEKEQLAEPVQYSEPEQPVEPEPADTIAPATQPPPALLPDNDPGIKPEPVPVLSTYQEETVPDNDNSTVAATDNDSTEIPLDTAAVRDNDELTAADNDQNSSVEGTDQNLPQSRIEVRGNPPEQIVYLDQVELGELPISIVAGSGFHSIECRKDGYITHSVRVRAIHGQSVTIDCELRKKTAAEESEQ
jgi:serine/threonine protein kinase